MKNRSKMSCQNQIKFVENILSKYRLRINRRQLPDFIFLRPFWPLNPPQQMDNQSFCNHYLRIQLHFQSNFNEETNCFLAAKGTIHHGAGTFKSALKPPQGIGSNEWRASKLTTVIRDRIIPSDPPGQKKSNPTIVSPSQKPAPDFQPATMEIPLRQLPVRKILSWKPYFNSGKSWGGPQPESSKLIQAGSKKEFCPALQVIQIPKIATLKSNQLIHTVIFPEVQNTVPVKPSSKNWPFFLREQSIYRTVPEKIGGNNSEYISGLGMGLSGTIRRPKTVLSKNEFVWRKAADTPDNRKRVTALPDAVQTTATVSTAASRSGYYPGGKEVKAAPDLDTIVAAVLKSLAKRIAIERDKRGRR